VKTADETATDQTDAECHECSLVADV